MRTIEQMVQQEINCCLSSLVATLAQGYGAKTPNDELDGMIDQAFELAGPVPDYEEAAIQAGWQEQPRDPEGQHIFIDSTDGQTWCAKDWEALCTDHDIDPIDSEVFEHWAISSWLAEKLIEQGEKVDTDFAGLNVWARQTTGQQISADGVIERIYSNMMKGV